MPQAEHANTPSPREGFDEALCDANIINSIIRHLAEGEITSACKPGASLYAWLADELSLRLESIEIAEMALRGGC